MHVTRLIRSGKVMAQKVGRAWMINEEAGEMNQINFEKTSSLQKWNKLIQKKFHKSLQIEQSKDREIIYSKMHSIGLPHERFVVFQPEKFPTKKEFEIAVGRIGFPYWLSCPPDQNEQHLDRQTKLRINNIKTGWNFINKLPEKNKYKIIVCEYADDPIFKGTVIVSPKGNGIAEFITGDRHYIMTRGFTLTDPMLFDQDGVQRFSKTIPSTKQKDLYKLVRGVSGHLELQYGKIANKNSITFFDYNDEEGYVEIDNLWANLKSFFATDKTYGQKKLYGLPASTGNAKGKCVVIHHENPGMYSKLSKGDILVSDTTTPEMTPLMVKASAIITDLGGVTSHAAIVCRELDIPAVVGVQNATEAIRTGNIVSVDAEKGEINILS
jgi:phosphohistidine swiveling domain-containing protein